MKTIGNKLRIARESQNRSLDDIASAIRINKNFLESIEQGTKPDLPAAYIHAFIKDYAKEVGLNPSELLDELRTSVQNAPDSSMTQTVGGMSQEFEQEQTIQSKLKINRGVPRQQLRVMVVLLLISITGLIVSIVWLSRDNSSKPVQEMSFTEVIKEHEAKVGVETDSTNIQSTTLAMGKNVRMDSLFLEGVASESVWVRVVPDGGSAVESILPPLHKKQWGAKKSFLLSIGNATAISFTLNGQKIGTFGTVRRSLKNIPLSLETLEQLKTKTP